MVRYLLFLPGGWFSFEDAGIHGFDVLHHQAKQLVAETEHELEEGERAIKKTTQNVSKQNMCVLPRVCA